MFILYFCSLLNLVFEMRLFHTSLNIDRKSLSNVEKFQKTVVIMVFLLIKSKVKTIQRMERFYR